jgi:hypothetical protein
VSQWKVVGKTEAHGRGLLMVTNFGRSGMTAV